jgi:hypothetical protein
MFALTLAAALAAGAAAAQQKTPDVFAVIPDPGFIENVTETSDGSFYATAAFDKILWKIGADHKVTKLATFPDQAATLGIAVLNDGFVLGAFKRGFIKGATVDFSDVGSQVLILDKTGKVTDTIPGPKGAAFNGLIADGRGKYLIADSHLPVIWQFDPATKKIDPWLKDDALSVSSAAEIGGDGLKVTDTAVYVSNKARLAIYKVERDANGRPKGGLTLVAKDLPTADDFAVAKDGTIYLPAPEKSKPGEKPALTRITPDGKITPFVADAPYSGSAIISRDGKWLYWATGVSGGLNGKQQELLRVSLP